LPFGNAWGESGEKVVKPAGVFLGGKAMKRREENPGKGKAMPRNSIWIWGAFLGIQGMEE
jgi:hypothetical protein